MNPSPKRLARRPFPALEVIALMFRMALALSLLNTGLLRYTIQKTGLPSQMSRYFPGMIMNPMGMGDGQIPGAEEYMQFLAPIQIMIGVAIALGFFTATFATAAGFMTLIPAMAQNVLLLVSGLPSDPNALIVMAMGTSHEVNLGNLLLAAAVMYLAANGKNPLSIDAMLFKSRARDSSGETLSTANGFPDPVPSEVPPGSVPVKFVAEGIAEGQHD